MASPPRTPARTPRALAPPPLIRPVRAAAAGAGGGGGGFHLLPPNLGIPIHYEVAAENRGSWLNAAANAGPLNIDTSTSNALNLDPFINDEEVFVLHGLTQGPLRRTGLRTMLNTNAAAGRHSRNPQTRAAITGPGNIRRYRARIKRGGSRKKSAKRRKRN